MTSIAMIFACIQQQDTHGFAVTAAQEKPGPVSQGKISRTGEWKTFHKTVSLKMLTKRGWGVNYKEKGLTNGPEMCAGILHIHLPAVVRCYLSWASPELLNLREDTLPFFKVTSRDVVTAFFLVSSSTSPPR